jgi:hypothetical protein
MGDDGWWEVSGVFCDYGEQGEGWGVGEKAGRIGGVERRVRAYHGSE